MAANPNFPINCGDTSQANPGTGDFILQGVAPAALASNLRVGKTVLPNGAQVQYLAVDNADKSKWEVGAGTYNSSTFHVTRTVVNSSNADATVNFTGTCNIYFTFLATGDPLGALTCNTNQPIPTSIVDVATNGTNYVGVTGANKIWVTTDPTVTSGWAGHESGTPALLSICRLSGVGYVGITTGASGSFEVWVNANEDGYLWVNQSVSLPFTPACIRTDGTTLVVCGTSATYPVTGSAAGQIWTSTDAVTWTQQTSNAGANNLNWLSWNATSAVMWCVGAAGKLLSAPAPFTTWTARTSNTAIALVRVEQTPDGTTGAIAISGDGSLIYTTAPGTPATAWTKVTATAGNSGTADASTGLAMSNTVYVIATSANTYNYSTNFTAWQKGGSGLKNGVCFGNANYFIANNTGSILAGSALNALTPYADAQLDAGWNCCVYHSGNSIYIAAGNAGLLSSFTTAFVATSRTSGFGSSNIQAGIYDSVSATVGFVGAGGKVFWSLNGTTGYTATTGTQATQLNAICTDASNTTNKFLCVGNSGVITTLNAAFVASTTQTSGITANLLGCASNGAGTYVAGGVNAIGHSTDAGVTWTWQNLMTNGIGTPSITFNSITHDGTQFVVMDNVGNVFQSTTGTGSWTLKSNAVSTSSGVLSYVNSTYVCSTSTGLILSSTDRLAWSIQRTGFAWGGSGIVAFLNSNFFIFGTTGYYQSTAGLAWSSYLGGNVSAATSLTGHLSAVNANGTVINSTDGATFSLVANQIPANVLGMANDATNMIAVTGSAVYRSTNHGSTWTQVASRPVFATFAGVPACAYGNGNFIVTGTLGYWIYSSDGGATWTAGTRVGHSFQSICYDAVIAKFIGVCTNGIIVTGTGTSFTANNGLVTAGSNIGASTRLATDNAGHVLILDGSATAVSAIYQTTDGSAFTQLTCPPYPAAGNVIVYLNSSFFMFQTTLVSTATYTSDRSGWFSRGFSLSVAGLQWGIYFNSKYIFFGGGMIATLS